MPAPTPVRDRTALPELLAAASASTPARRAGRAARGAVPRAAAGPSVGSAAVTRWALAAAVSIMSWALFFVIPQLGSCQPSLSRASSRMPDSTSYWNGAGSAPAPSRVFEPSGRNSARLAAAPTAARRSASR